MNERKLISLWEKALIILVIVLISVLFFVLIASGITGYKELQLQASGNAKTEEPLIIGGVIGRHIDTEAGVVCYVFSGGGGSCFLIEDTLLRGGE